MAAGLAVTGSGVAMRDRVRNLEPMESHELLKEVLKKTSAKQIAAEMSLSLSLIYKWAEPPVDGTGSGANNPLDRIEQLVRITGDGRIAQWICELAGDFISLTLRSSRRTAVNSFHQ